jgi:16S rRNA (guanine527-N7)-methyltransferase
VEKGLAARIAEVSRVMGCAPHPAGFEVWLAELKAWNAKIDLTAARDDDELVDLMLADALALAPHIPLGARVIDVGTGAGAPGIALALARPDLKVTLVEPKAKRVSFMRTVLAKVGRLDVQLERASGESMVGKHTWDVALSRATLPPPAWLALGRKLAATTWVLLAQGGPPEPDPQEDVEYTWPLTKAARRAVRY